MNSIFIGTPMYGGQCYGAYTDSLIQVLSLLSHNKIPAMYRFIYNESLITRARDMLAHEFLKSDCTHLLFIDSDVVINPDDILRLLQDDKDIIGGCYPRKELNIEKIVNIASQGVPINQVLPSSLEYVFNVFENNDNTVIDTTEVKDTGTGYMLIKRNVFDKLMKVTPSYKSNFKGVSEEIFSFFQTSIDKDTCTLLSEDYHFCSEYRKIGGKIYVAPYARAHHIGSFRFG